MCKNDQILQVYLLNLISLCLKIGLKQFTTKMFKWISYFHKQ